jgi:hypothetical protein
MATAMPFGRSRMETRGAEDKGREGVLTFILWMACYHPGAQFKQMAPA